MSVGYACVVWYLHHLACYVCTNWKVKFHRSDDILQGWVKPSGRCLAEQRHRFLAHDANCYATARYMPWPCVRARLCLSQVGVLSKRMDASRRFLPRELPATKLTLLYENSGTTRTLDLGNFATASRRCCQQNSSTVEFVDCTYCGRRVVAGRTYVQFITRRSTVTL